MKLLEVAKLLKFNIDYDFNVVMYDSEKDEYTIKFDGGIIDLLEIIQEQPNKFDYIVTGVNAYRKKDLFMIYVIKAQA